MCAFACPHPSIYLYTRTEIIGAVTAPPGVSSSAAVSAVLVPVEHTDAVSAATAAVPVLSEKERIAIEKKR